MEIREISEPAEIVSILALADDKLEKQVLKKVECTKAEWVQWLENMLKRRDFMRIWGVVEDKKVQAYLVAVNAVAPPISRSVMILYQNFFGLKDGKETSLKFKKEEAEKTYLMKIWPMLEKWGQELGARQCQISTHVPRINSAFGFVAEKGVSMSKPIDYDIEYG